MEIAVFGANGQLGRCIRAIADNYPQHKFLFTDIDDLDIANYAEVADFVYNNYPKAFINCAAYTDVDMAERDKKMTTDANQKGADNLAKLAAEHNIFLVHISTDYVYDGEHYKPYKETDSVHPRSVYARSKWKGEVAIRRSLCRAAIIRTAWLYSEYGTNFVKTMLKMGAEEQEINIIFDQIGTPTYARDLAKAIMQIIAQMEKIQEVETFHYSNEGVASWYDFAVEIMQLAKRNCKILPISTQQYPSLVKRPHYAVLSKQKIKETFEMEIPHWRESLRRCIANLEAARV
ncbi:MAG: dTDP-4-dehydrorhamnose reductase [Lentimicrobiaceae bacterium]|nr:dTDP-4-dehydrorhamnose reductase [Lentimicrobiaceae bacterium]